MTPAPLRRQAAALCLAAVLAVLVPAAACADLDAYLARAEPACRWDKVSESKTIGCRIVDLHLVSQTWRGAPWEHRIRIFRPDRLEFPGHAILMVTGGNGSDRDNIFATMAAIQSGMVMAIVYNVPNQPLFHNLVEDDLIAHTCVEFLKSGDEEWPLLFPMVKTAVKAMDAVAAHAGAAWQQSLDHWFVTGASKRGWTTWLTGAADKRVQGIMPMVFDNLNFNHQMVGQMMTWGRYSEEIDEYTSRGLQQALQTEVGQKLIRLLDPYQYRDRLTLPKLIINGTNDPYWTLDALNRYWDGLTGDKAVIYVPNTGHGAGSNPTALSSGLAFVRLLAAGRSLPHFEWQHTTSGSEQVLRVSPDADARSVRLWHARSATRDFRQGRWQSQELTAEVDAAGHRAWVGRIAVPEDEFVALLGEVTFTENGKPYSLSTTVHIAGRRKLE